MSVVIFRYTTQLGGEKMQSSELEKLIKNIDKLNQKEDFQAINKAVNACLLVNELKGDYGMKYVTESENVENGR